MALPHAHTCARTAPTAAPPTTPPGSSWMFPDGAGGEDTLPIPRCSARSLCVMGIRPLACHSDPACLTLPLTPLGASTLKACLPSKQKGPSLLGRAGASQKAMVGRGSRGSHGGPHPPLYHVCGGGAGALPQVPCLSCSFLILAPGSFGLGSSRTKRRLPGGTLLGRDFWNLEVRTVFRKPSRGRAASSRFGAEGMGLPAQVHVSTLLSVALADWMPTHLPQLSWPPRPLSPPVTVGL